LWRFNNIFKSVKNFKEIKNSKHFSKLARKKTRNFSQSLTNHDEAAFAEVAAVVAGWRNWLSLKNFI
jgi:hypothetical protein